MGIFEDNMAVLTEFRPFIADGIRSFLEESEKSENVGENREEILIGDALDGESFMVLKRGEELFALNSTYHPAHQAMRYTEQFEGAVPQTIVLLYGFSDGQVIRGILDENCSVCRCIVYEPSIDIFYTALCNYDLQDILSDGNLDLCVKGINSDAFESELDDSINYTTWRNFKLKTLSQYEELFPEDYRWLVTLYQRIRSAKATDMNTLIAVAKRSLADEVRALEWMIDARTVNDLKGKIDSDIPYIVVAAGPSLEKNVDLLKQAKGKSVIVCVDSAIKFLISKGIMPDIICTIDPVKGRRHFKDCDLSEIPVVVSTDSSHNALEEIGIKKPYVISTSNDYYEKLFQEKGRKIGFFDGGGSVATVCFQMGVALGFEKIVLIGQDLAFTDKKAHAGNGDLKESDMLYGFSMVEGYYGKPVATRSDLKNYIDWYNLHIPQLQKDHMIINATEGGAKLTGAIQMPLQDVIDQYCTKEVDVSSILESVPKVWGSREEQEEYYYKIQKKYQFFVSLSKRMEEGLSKIDRALLLLHRGNFQPKELKQIDKYLSTITNAVETEEGMVILVKRMIETEITLNDDLHETNDNLNQESIRLYEKMKKYIGDLLAADQEMLPIWKESLENLNKKYNFE